MIKIYEIPSDKSQQIKSILETPDGVSGELNVKIEKEQGKGNLETAKSWKINEFKKQGYTLKEAKFLDIDKKVFYLYIKADEAFFKRNEAVLINAGAKILKSPDSDNIIKKIENMDSEVSSGIGLVFG